MTSLLANSNPVRRISDDRLGRADFARAIAGIVRAPRNDGLVVIGIEGPWGAGKSSVLSMASSELARDRRNRVVVVSAWRTSSQDQFLSNLSYSLTTALRRDWQSAPIRIAFAKLMRQPLSMVMAIFLPFLTIVALAILPEFRDWVKGIVDKDPKKLAASLGIFGLPLLAFLYSKLSQPVLDGVKSWLGNAKGDSIGALERFAFDFDVIAAAQRKGTRFVVLVEDLDRCTPDHQTDVLSAIAQMWSHPKADRIAFLLAYDREVVLKGIAQGAVKHLVEAKEGSGGGASDRGRMLAADYLDRIVQLELPLPDPEPSGGAEREFQWPLIPSVARGFAYSVAVVGLGLMLLGGKTAAGFAFYAIFVVISLFVVDVVGSWFCRPTQTDATPEDWSAAASSIARWIDDQPLRVRARIMNRAGAALGLRPGRGLTAWEAVSIAALATRFPDSFGVASLAASRGGGKMDIDSAFNRQEVTDVIRQMESDGHPIGQFEDSDTLHAVVSAFTR
jgi:hypothetical protein